MVPARPAIRSFGNSFARTVFIADFDKALI